MLPPGTLAALKGHHNGVVTVVLFATSVAAMSAGAPPWSVILLLVISVAAFHIRYKAAESHERELLWLKIAQTLARIEAAKTRHGFLPLSEQPDLPLAPARATADQRAAGDGGSR